MSVSPSPIRANSSATTAKKSALKSKSQGASKNASALVSPPNIEMSNLVMDDVDLPPQPRKQLQFELDGQWRSDQ